jgi:acyl carrier protein
MTHDEILERLLGILQDLAPEADVRRLNPDLRVRDQLDIDSMDLLNFVIAVDEQLGVDIPERDYPKLRTLNDLVRYVDARLGDGATPEPGSAGQGPNGA